MRKLVKDSEDNVLIISTVNGFIPDGYTEVAEEDIATEELALARRQKMTEIRARRDAMMLEHDRLYLIALKESASTVALLADREILLDLPQVAQTAIDVLETIEEVKLHDAFAELELSQSYE